MAWTKHILGAAKLPQKCVRCGVVLIEEKYVTHHGGPNDGEQTLVADPLDREGEAIYCNPEEGGHITTNLPPDVKFQECSKS